MQMVEIITKKRDGLVLNQQEIDDFVQGFTRGEIPDYQAAALLMAIVLKGMDARETADLTNSMTHSGQTVDLSAVGDVVCDKHSTGGVGDTTTLILAPLVAACGLKMAKMSGRGLGHTGGTLDKLEAIPGYQVEISPETLVQLVRTNGAAIIGQTQTLAPADKKLYALRDVTGTVESLPLIASSVMSKKLAAGTDIIVLDVKTGSGAFMHTVEDSFALARTMVAIGTHLGKRIAAIVTDMDQPLGSSIGNAMDVREAIEILQGKHLDSPLREVCLLLGEQLLRMAGKAQSGTQARAMLEQALQSGAALKKMRTMIQAQGGDSRVCEDVSILGQAAVIHTVVAPQAGYIARMHAAEIGMAAQMLGAGRMKKEDVIDPLVGIQMRVRVGDFVEKGQPMADFHLNDLSQAEQAEHRFLQAIVIEKQKPSAAPLVFGIVRAEGEERFF